MGLWGIQAPLSLPLVISDDLLLRDGTASWGKIFVFAGGTAVCCDPGLRAVAAHSLVCAGKVFQDKACSANNCSDGLVDFEVHVSDEERFHFESECCQGDTCKNASDGGCWPAPQVPLFSISTSPFTLVLRASVTSR